MGLKYRGWAVALTAGLILSLAGGAAVLAGEPAPDDVVLDGTVTVTWVDPDDGPMAGASIQLFFYREGDKNPGSLPAATMDADGAVVISGVPRPAEGAAPVLLDVRGDRSTATVDEAGCTTLEGWQAEATGVAGGLAVDVVLTSDTKSISITCPEPTPTPDVVDPTPTPEPTAPPDVVQPTPTSTSTGGAVLGAVGTPGVTPPATDAVATPASPGSSPFVPGLLALLAVAGLLVPATSLAFARAKSRR